MGSMQTLALPDPVASFAPSPTCLPTKGALDLFALLGGEGRIVSADLAGEAVLYDADERLFLRLPRVNEPKGCNPACISVALPGAAENSLYVMERRPGEATYRYHRLRDDHRTSCFDVLEFGPRRGGPEVRDMHKGWRWRFLPPPPFVFRPGGYETSQITSWTSVLNASNGCSTICVSCDGMGSAAGTYCFDTSRHLEEWRHAGDRRLPFTGKAEYVPEFDLWFGFSPQSPNHLCAVELSSFATSK